MPSSDKTVQEILAELIQDYEIEPAPTSFFQRGILTQCDPAPLADHRLINNVLKNILGINDFKSESINHLKIYTGSSTETYCSLIVDSNNSSLIYSLVSLEAIPESFEETLARVLRPQKRTGKKLEF
jgi:hypothetical protein